MDTKHTHYPVPAEFESGANMDLQTYSRWYQASIETPADFWLERAAQQLTFIKKPSTTSDLTFIEGKTTWFEDATLNVSVNCIDRHLPERAEQTAIIFEADEPNQHQHITYQQLHQAVCQFTNVLKSLGVRKGDRVCIYMPMIPQAAYAMLACARMGAIHSVVFGGFSANALQDRLLDAQCTCLITADEGIRGGKIVPLKANADQALKACPDVRHCVVIKHTGNRVDWCAHRDVDYDVAMEGASHVCDPEPMAAEDPLFILYTSGSTGKPKGVLHTTAGYLLQVSLTHRYVLDYREGDIYWCTADLGWITGHSYILYGPLCNGATTLMFEGVPTYPDVSRFWQVVDQHQVNIFYTAPTAIRALMAQGDAPVKACRRSSLRLLGTVGEPINPEAWSWYHQVVGDSRCPIVDTWWQTETGAIMIAPLPGAMALKPGSAGLPFFGVVPVLIDPEGHEVSGPGQGHLVIQRSWPSQIRTVFGDHTRFLKTYFSQYSGYYFTGDGAVRDKDGYYWISGRVDDVLNVSGHRLGTAEIESALVLHEAVAEAAVVGCPHPITSESIYAFVCPMKDIKPDSKLAAHLIKWVAAEISPIAKPGQILWVDQLPKTRSGKIMRRILRNIACGAYENLGDVSTLANAACVEQIVESHKAQA